MKTKKEFVLECREKRMNYRQISELLGISRQRVAQLAGYVHPKMLKQREISRIKKEKMLETNNIKKEKIFTGTYSECVNKAIDSGNIEYPTGYNLYTYEDVREGREATYKVKPV